MLEFEMPTSSYVSHERTPPEVEELSLLLNEALVVIPDVAPVLALGAVTGMRRGELVGIRRSRVIWHENRITVDLAVDEARRIKSTKTRRERSVHVDAETMEMLRRHCQLMDERAAACDIDVGPDAFVFSLEPDCSKPLHPDFVTKRVGVLKDHLGIAEKSPETIALEDEALRLFRQPRIPRPPGSRGLPPKGALPFTEIGRRLGRSNRWAVLAIKSAERREAAKARGIPLNFDGSILALRKFTSSELLDAGFNISAVAQRQGHGPQVLMEHYAKSRRSADRKAAEHLGRVVHGRPPS
jgi:integrase